MIDNSALSQINPDPRILTTLVIGTEDNVRAHILRQHTLGMAEASAWSKSIPVPHCPDKVMCVLNRIML
jgi:hypothetical protein